MRYSIESRDRVYVKGYGFLGDSNDETNFPHKLLSTDRQV